MRTINPHTLLGNKPQYVQVHKNLEDYYLLWKELYKENAENPTSFDAFIAGYFIGNNVALRAKYLEMLSTNRKLGIDN